MNHTVKKIIVYGSSFLIVGGIIGGGIFLKNSYERAKEEAAYTDPLPVMTQEEMEALYDRHKNEPAILEESITDESTDVESEEGSEPVTSKEEASELPEDTVTVQGTGEPTESPNRQENPNLPDSPNLLDGPVDFEGMWEVNEDVYAWITVPGTVIDYPILQHATDNSYYLNYNIDGSYGYPGCIYTENMNSKTFSDNNTVIYGHNMKNGTMFAGLHKFEDSSFFEENDSVLIYTPDKQLTYKIFAAYTYDDRHLMYSFNFADKAVYSNYLNEVLNMRSLNANIREGVAVSEEDKIITLVTCIANQPEKRLLVQAVLQEGGN